MILSKRGFHVKDSTFQLPIYWSHYLIKSAERKNTFIAFHYISVNKCVININPWILISTNSIHVYHISNNYFSHYLLIVWVHLKCQIFTVRAYLPFCSPDMCQCGITRQMSETFICTVEISQVVRLISFLHQFTCILQVCIWHGDHGENCQYSCMCQVYFIEYTHKCFALFAVIINWLVGSIYS